jgi:hypothetical protein
MKSRNRLGGVIFATAAAVMAVNLGVTTALAASTTLNATVTQGGSYKGTATSATLTDNGVSLTCSTSGKTPAVSVKGNVPDGTTQGASPLKVGTAKALSFNNCTGPLGAVTVTPIKESYAVKADSATSSTGQTDMIISGIDTSVSMSGCSFTVTGSVPGYYTNSNSTLTLTPDLPMKPLSKAQLTVGNVNGCAGLVNNGDHPTFTTVIIIIHSEAGWIIIVIIISGKPHLIPAQ